MWISGAHRAPNPTVDLARPAPPRQRRSGSSLRFTRCGQERCDAVAGSFFDAVTEGDLQDDAGQWFQAGCDVAISLPILDQTIKRKHPEFNEEYYGYRSFSQLLEDAQARKLLSLKKDQRSGSYIVTLAE